MDCIILQNTYCACIDLSDQLHSIMPEVKIPFMTEEAFEIVTWLKKKDRHVDWIIADTEACDGDTIDIFRCSGVDIPLILTCCSFDEIKRTPALNVIGMMLKPINRQSLRKVLSEIYNQCVI